MRRIIFISPLAGFFGLGFFGLGLVLFSMGCATDRSIIDDAQQVHGSLQPAVIHDGQVAGYLQAIGERVIVAAKQADADHVGPKTHFDKKQRDDWMFSSKMQFHLVNSKTLNAFTTGGEHMYIYNALFQQCQSEDELAAVVSHEYAHVYCRHVAQGKNHQLTTLIAGAAVGGAAGYAAGGNDRLAAAQTGAGVGAAGGQFVNMGFTRQDENEADKFGFYFYTHAGWAPSHFGDFFQRMIDLGYDKTPELLSDHPTLKSRAEATAQRVKELPPDASQWTRSPIADASRFRAIQKRAAQLGKSLPDDQSLQSSQKLLQALPRSCIAPVDPDDAVQARAALANQAGSAPAKKKKQ